MPNFLERYLSGEYEVVWNELCALGPVAVQPPVLAEATAVAEEIVRRIKRNAETVGRFLQDAGYEFALPGPFAFPANDTTVCGIRQIERDYGRLPLFLKAWWNQVDHLNCKPSERFLKKSDACYLQGLYPASDLDIQGPGQCITESRNWHESVRTHWDLLVESGEPTAGNTNPNDVILLLGPTTSGNCRVGYQFPIEGVDAPCNRDEPEENLVEWLRYAFLVKGGLGWNYFGIVQKPSGEREFLSFIRPQEEVREIVRSMNLIPF